MPTLTRSLRISGRAEDVWQELTDFRNWPRLSAQLSHVELVDSVKNPTRLECRDVAGLVFKAQAHSQESQRALSVVVDPSTVHPLGIKTLDFSLSPQAAVENGGEEHTTHLQLSLDYQHRLPILGGILERFGRQAERITFIESLLTGLSQRMQKKHWQYKENVRTILARKGRAVISAAPHALVSQLTQLISENRIGAILIVDEHENLVGLVSERDIVNSLSSDGTSVLRKTAADIMTRNLIVVEPDTDLMFVMACMTDNKIRHLPVIENGELVGVISIGDVVQQRIHALEADSDTMRDYIAAREWRYHSPNGSPVAGPSAKASKVADAPMESSGVADSTAGN